MKFLLHSHPQQLLLLSRRQHRRQLLRLEKLLLLLMMMMRVNIDDNMVLRTGVGRRSSPFWDSDHRRGVVISTDAEKLLLVGVVSWGAIIGEGGRLEDGDHGGLGADVVGEFFLGLDEVGLDLAEAVLEEGDEADAAVDGVAEAGLGLVGEGVDGVLALGGGQLLEELRDVAGSEHLVDVAELLGLVRREVRREHAVLRALPPLYLARRAWCVR